MDTVIDTRTLQLVRLLNAPRERVFAAWTEAEQFKAWMCPPGAGIGECSLDARPGGTWRAKGFRPDGSRFDKAGVYLKVRRPELLVFTWTQCEPADGTGAQAHVPETTVRIELRALGQRTELTLTQGPFTDMPSFTGHHDGWNGSFDKLEVFLRRAA